MPQTLLVQDYMTKSPHTIGVALTLTDAKNLMRAYRIRHLPVLDGGALVGIVSDRDIQLVATRADVEEDEASVEEAMTQVPYTVTPTTPLEIAARHMSRHRLGSTVVVEGNKVVGVFTTTDAMKALADVLAAVPGRLARPAPTAIVKAASNAIVLSGPAQKSAKRPAKKGRRSSEVPR
jgi:acetoin utilization protein AcuB